MKKKTPEQVDPHVREAGIAEGYRKQVEPTTTPMSITGIPMQVITPIPMPSPGPVKLASFQKKELRMIKGIDNEIATKMDDLDIRNIDDLAKASGGKLASQLRVSVATAQKWIERAKELA